MDGRNTAVLTRLARQRQTELDEGIASWQQGDAAKIRIWCGPGCGNCCTLTVNTTLSEAFAICAALDDVQRQQLHASVAKLKEHARQCSDPRAFLTGYRDAVGPCPFLDATNNCSIYACRPLACRALLATRPPDWCGVNLALLPEIDRDGFLASLDRKVVAWPTHYAAAPQDLASELERGLIFAMFRAYGFGVTGSLLLMVDLAGRPDCMSALASGVVGFQTFLAEQACSQSFLVQIHEP